MKVQDGTALQGNSSKHTMKNVHLYFSKNSKKTKEHALLPIIYMIHLPQHQNQMNTLPKKKKDRKLEANNFDEYSYKNPQQYISKLNPSIYKKDQTQ